MKRRIKHAISGQQGTLVSSGTWYSSVRFDGDKWTSWVSNDSVRELSSATIGSNSSDKPTEGETR